MNAFNMVCDVWTVTFISQITTPALSVPILARNWIFVCRTCGQKLSLLANILQSYFIGIIFFHFILWWGFLDIQVCTRSSQTRHLHHSYQSNDQYRTISVLDWYGQLKSFPHIMFKPVTCNSRTKPLSTSFQHSSVLRGWAAAITC